MPLSFAMVCASNMNRSMAAHKLLKEENLNVHSFGTGSQVKLPGPTINKPNVYNFGTTYKEIIQDLVKKDEKLYNQNGLLMLLKRNQNIKLAPQKWQDNMLHFDVVFCFDDRVFEAVIDDYQNRDSFNHSRTVHVINMATKDNHEEAEKGAYECLRFCQNLSKIEDWEDKISDFVKKFEIDSQRKLLHVVFFD